MVRWLFVFLTRYIFALLFLFVLAVAARREKNATVSERKQRQKPRLVYGPIPIISIKYMSQAMGRLGYEAKTFVYGVYGINSRTDFDYFLSDFIKTHRLNRIRTMWRLLPHMDRYLVFLWLLPRFDVYHFFFDGGFLAGTPLQFFEIQLLHRAGKKVVVMPYGSDVAVPSHINSLPLRHGLMMNYSYLAQNEKRILRRIEYFSKKADFIVACLVHMETLPRWDLLTTHYYPIDTEAWGSSGHSSPANGRNGAVTIVHAPNHRGLKGTEFLVAACKELQAEGLQIYLRLLERVPNTEVRRVLNEADILAEQFILGYALNAMEGMSLGKPVMSNLSDDHYYQVLRLFTGLDECPIVNTPVSKIKDNLRMLVTNPELRRELGDAGRRYVLKFHSYTAVGSMWENVYRKIWYGDKIYLNTWHPGQYPASEKNSQKTASKPSCTIVSSVGS